MKKVYINILFIVICISLCSCSSISIKPPGSTHSTQTDNKAAESSPVISYPIPLKAPCQAKTIYTVSSYENYDTAVTLSSLQGLAALKGTDQIMINIGAYPLFSPYMESVYGASIKNSTTWELVEIFKDKIDGYILCDNAGTSASLNVATSLVNQLNAIIITTKYEEKAISIGLKKIIDVTGKDDSWLRSSEYFAKLSKNIALSQDITFGPQLRDYAVMTNAYTFYAANEQENINNFSFLNNNSLIFGWNDKLGEFGTVSSFSSINANLIPSNHAHNLSSLSGFKLDSIKQKTAISNISVKEKHHTVCFIMSDGDNLQYLLNNYADTQTGNWFGSSIRGTFSMGWGLPPLTIDLAPPMMNYLYDNMTSKDEFIMQIGGLGYTYPSKWTDKDALFDMASHLNEYMKRSDMSIATIVDDNAFTTANLDVFTKQDAIKALFYIDFSDYSKHKGHILWSNNKPAISAKYRLWAGVNGGSINEIAAALNNSSRDISSPEAYSLIIVHAWSGVDKNENFVLNGNTMQAINIIVDKLDDDIDVVTPSEFADRILKNTADRT